MLFRRPLPDPAAAQLTPSEVLASTSLLRRVASELSPDEVAGGAAGEEVLLSLQGLGRHALLCAAATWLQLTVKVCTPDVARLLPVGRYAGPRRRWAPSQVGLLPAALVHAGDAAVFGAWQRPRSAAAVPDAPLVELHRVRVAAEAVTDALASLLGRRSGEFLSSLEAAFDPLAPHRWPKVERSEIWRFDLLHSPLVFSGPPSGALERFAAERPRCSYTSRYPSLLSSGGRGSLSPPRAWLGHLSAASSALVEDLAGELSYGPGAPGRSMLFDPLPPPWTSAPYRRLEAALDVGASPSQVQPLPAPSLESLGNRSLRVALPLRPAELVLLEDVLLAHSRMLAASLLGLPDLTVDARSLLSVWAAGLSAAQLGVPGVVDSLVRRAVSEGLAWSEPPPGSLAL